MTEKFYEIRAYQENGFASSEWSVSFYKNKDKARKKCSELNQNDKNTLYDICERIFDD